MKYVLAGLDSFEKTELDKYWENYDPKKDDPKILGIAISASNRCNLRCVYCYAGEQKPLPNELNLREQQDIITQAAELGAKTVVICGDGEPSIDPNLCGIVECAHSLNMKTIVVTNGIIFGDDPYSTKVHHKNGEELLSFLKNNGVSFVLKLESIVQESYESIVGVKGAFQKYMTSIDRICKAGFNKLEQNGDVAITRIAFSAVIMKSNINELTDLKQFADDHNAQFICKLPSLVGRALNNLSEMFEVSRYEEIRKSLLGYTAKRETLMVDTPRCMAWHYGPCIGVDGEIRECYTSACGAESRIGNVRELPLKELIKRKNQQYDISNRDFCPVKTRINQKLIDGGMQKLWVVCENNVNQAEKVLSF